MSYGIVLVDMDGVIADFDASATVVVPEQHRLTERTNFYLADDYPAYSPEINLASAQPDFFENLQLIPGALEGWERLITAGYEPRICSAPLTRNPNAVVGKIKFLEKYFVPEFGKAIVETAIIDKNKFNYPGLALIDDRPELDTGQGKAQWQHIVFDRSYNQQSTAGLRLYGWHDPNLETMLGTLIT